MKQILLFGAGKSATVLIDYLLGNAEKEGWRLLLADVNLALAKEKIGQSEYGEAISFDINDEEKRAAAVRDASIVISMLPPSLHNLVAIDCVKYSRHLLTASYVDDEIRRMGREIKEKGILFLCEMGLDPGIDHMSAMQLIDEIHSQGGKVESFRSHCGGLVAPESDDNPWHYKISWNPRNIILAGKAGAHYREENQEVRWTHAELFAQQRQVNVPGLGQLSWYPNRDSLSYAPLYGLTDTATFLRTTLRHPDFMHGWDKIIALKLTEETIRYQSAGKSLAGLFREHLSQHQLDIESFINGDPLFNQQIAYLGFFAEDLFPELGSCSAADMLQFAVERSLRLNDHDRDMIVMLHEFGYRLGDEKKKISSSLIVKGDDRLRTAMAKTVGLPLGIACKLILQGKIQLTGLHIPTAKELYEPVLAELESFDIKFQEDRR